MHKLLLFMAIVIVGCSDKSSIDEHEIKKILNSYFAKNCIILQIDQEESFKIVHEDSMPSYVKNEMNKYEFFTKLGYYKVQKEADNKNEKGTLLKTYRLTQEGQKNFVYRKQRLSVEQGFCAGHCEATKIIKVIKIDKIFNREALRVEFMSKVSRKYDFAKTAYFLEVFQDFNSFTSNTQKATLILTENGWKVKKE